jgi:hypothetical protein
MRRGRYYLARVMKLGQLTPARFTDALLRPPVLPFGNFEWTVTDVVDNTGSTFPYIYGNLSKFSRSGAVKVIDENERRQLPATANNLLEASAPFVYLPEYSGLAYLHVWNGIQVDVFPRRLKAIVEAASDGFFVECAIEPVSDYRKFLQRLRSIDRITELSARVHPPNPLFGRLWAELDDYIKSRNAEEVVVKEVTTKKGGLDTALPNVVAGILDNSQYQPQKALGLTDAALLMAADGYGAGQVVGRDGDQEVRIQTAETQKNFMFKREPEPDELAEQARLHFDRITKDRDMKH